MRESVQHPKCLQRPCEHGRSLCARRFAFRTERILSRACHNGKLNHQADVLQIGCVHAPDILTYRLPPTPLTSPFAAASFTNDLPMLLYIGKADGIICHGVHAV